MISLSVFARTDEVKNGNFVPYDGANARVVQGVNLGVTKAGNKGAVGMGFRYYDASIAFLVCVILFLLPSFLPNLTHHPPSLLLSLETCHLNYYATPSLLPSLPPSLPPDMSFCIGLQGQDQVGEEELRCLQHVEGGSAGGGQRGL
jgi:hypothetical protein